MFFRCLGSPERNTEDRLRKTTQDQHTTVWGWVSHSFIRVHVHETLERTSKRTFNEQVVKQRWCSRLLSSGLQSTLVRKWKHRLRLHYVKCVNLLARYPYISLLAHAFVFQIIHQQNHRHKTEHQMPANTSTLNTVTIFSSTVTY